LAGGCWKLMGGVGIASEASEKFFLHTPPRGGVFFVQTPTLGGCLDADWLLIPEG